MNKIIETALTDPPGTNATIPRDPAAAGKVAAGEQITYLHQEGVTNVTVMQVGNKSKVTRFQPFAVAAEHGLVDYIIAPWNEAYFSELEAFDGSRRCIDDQLDATSDSYMALATKKTLPNFLGGLQAGSITRTSNLPFG